MSIYSCTKYITESMILPNFNIHLWSPESRTEKPQTVAIKSVRQCVHNQNWKYQQRPAGHSGRVHGHWIDAHQQNPTQMKTQMSEQRKTQFKWQYATIQQHTQNINRYVTTKQTIPRLAQMTII